MSRKSAAAPRPPMRARERPFSLKILLSARCFTSASWYACDLSFS